jgi:hypothetical protein
MSRTSRFALLALSAVALTGAGCGSSKPSTAGSPAAGSPAASTSSALSADATSAATGDIPDNQNFLPYRSSSPRFQMVYPEGWTVKQTKDGVTFKEKNNLVRIAVASGPAPTTTVAQAQLATLKHSDPTLVPGAAKTVLFAGRPAVKITYTTQSAPNPVTGKSVTLMVDRYELDHNGQVATVDLGTPTGVDNVDAYKKMITSYRWG